MRRDRRTATIRKAASAMAMAVLSGCGASELSKSSTGPGQSCPGNSVSIALAMVPESVVRGEATWLEVRWDVSKTLWEPIWVELSTQTDPRFSVTLNLERDHSTSDIRYSGGFVNPFGVGAPAGAVAILAASTAVEPCSVAPTAASAFSLE